MGGVAVLHPQDCLKGPLPNKALILSHHTTKRPSRNSNPNPNPNPKANRTNRRKRIPTGTGSPPARTMVTKIPAASKNLVMGEVKILKRGEDLSPSKTASDLASDVEKVDNNINNNYNNNNKNKEEVGDLGLKLTDRLGPDPAVVAKQVGVIGGFYAGSAFFTSPPPSSLPLPGFFANNKLATSDLLRMLRLNLT